MPEICRTFCRTWGDVRAINTNTMKQEAVPFLEGRSIVLLMQGFRMQTPDGKTKYARLRISTGLTIDPTLWDGERGRPSPAYSLADQFRLEQAVQAQVMKLNVARSRANEEGEVTPERVKEIFQDLNGAKKAAPVAAVDCKLIDMVKELQGKAQSDLTAASYGAFLKKVEAFDHKIRMSQLTETWRERFFNWIRVNHKLKPNSMWTQAKHLNACINEAKARRMNVRIDTSHPFALSTPQTDYLDWSDLNRLVRFEPKTDKLKEIKTIVLAMAFTSARISDLWKVFDTISVRNGVLSAAFHTKKKCGDSNPYVMPVILKPLKDQIEAHGVPKKRSEDGIRVGIRELLEAAGITKGSIIGPHDLRRSFITNFIGLGVFSEILIARIFTGHQLASNGDLKVMAGYDQADITAKQKTFLKLLGTLDVNDTGGLRLM